MREGSNNVYLEAESRAARADERWLSCPEVGPCRYRNRRTVAVVRRSSPPVVEGDRIEPPPRPPRHSDLERLDDRSHQESDDEDDERAATGRTPSASRSRSRSLWRSSGAA
jgi:hypothetical protein